MSQENDISISMNVKRLNKVLIKLISYMKDLNDENRDLPIEWNIMHMYSSSQLAKIIALKRGLNVEVASLAAALHDMGVVVTKRRESHAKVAEDIVRNIINEYNSDENNLPEITKKEEEMIIRAIIHHSDKQNFSDDPMVELIKDVDSIDRYLHGVKTKGAYLKRCKKVLKELNIKQ